MTTPADLARPHLDDDGSDGSDLSRRRFVGYVLAGTTLVTAADFTALSRPAAALPAVPPVSPPELFDLNDFLTLTAAPTAAQFKITLNEDGTASMALPRSENGQGIVTSTAMIIAEELGLTVDQVDVTLAPAIPELLFNQLTGGSNTTISTYIPIRIAAAVARGALLDAAARITGSTLDQLTIKGGVVTGALGLELPLGELAKAAAEPKDRQVIIDGLTSPSDFTVIGQGTKRTDARDAVTGKKVYATDMNIDGVLPTMVARGPKLNAKPTSFDNKSEVEGMPGVTDAVMVDFGIAVRAETFGQCIDAVRAVKATWGPGTAGTMSDADVLDDLRQLELPFPAIPDLELPIVDLDLTKTLTTDHTYYFRSNSPMDTNSAVATFEDGKLEVWAGLKSPITAKQEIEDKLGIAASNVTVNVIQGGGSFGRRLFFDGALEAATIAQAMGKGVKLMWHRADDARAGRTHPMCTSRIQAILLPEAKEVAAFVQLHTSVETDYRHGLGERISAFASKIPGGNNLGFGQTVFLLTQELPYDFGVNTQQLLESTDGLPIGQNLTANNFNTSSMRNIYSPDVRCSAELMIDEIAREFDEDRLDFRLRTLRVESVKKVLEEVATKGGWKKNGEGLPDGITQGIAIHKEYKGATACLIELDTRPETVNRVIEGAAPDSGSVTGPRVTKVVFAVDAGLVINPLGLEAQMQGGISDGIAQAFTSSLHLADGHFREASWDNYFYTRQWNHPPQVEIHIVEPDEPERKGVPGGAGEAGVAASFAAASCAFAQAQVDAGKEPPTYFPVNHRGELAFDTKPYTPSIPQSPTNGLKFLI